MDIDEDSISECTKAGFQSADVPPRVSIWKPRNSCQLSYYNTWGARIFWICFVSDLHSRDICKKVLARLNTKGSLVNTASAW